MTIALDLEHHLGPGPASHGDRAGTRGVVPDRGRGRAAHPGCARHPHLRLTESQIKEYADEGGPGFGADRLLAAAADTVTG